MQLLDSDLIIDSSANLESPLVFSLAQARWHIASVCEWWSVQDGTCGGQFITGWEETLPLMRAGELSECWVKDVDLAQRADL